VTAVIETKPVPGEINEDSADDPAIWVNQADHDKTVIIGTDKKGGLATYSIKGEQLIGRS